jgi:thioredoxin reductase (NADPH)
MTIPGDQFALNQEEQANEPANVREITAEFRRDLAFPKLTEEMVQRLREYGREEIVDANVTLYTFGDRDTDMFVILEG